MLAIKLTQITCILLGSIWMLTHGSVGSRLMGDTEYSDTEDRLVRLKLLRSLNKVTTENYDSEIHDYQLAHSFANIDTFHAKESDSRSIFRTNLSNFRHLNYYSQIEVGNPAKVFNVLIDTASTDFWLISAECMSQLCINKNAYNGSSSSDHVADGKFVSITYASMVEISGHLCYDRLKLGSWTITKQPLIEAIDLSGDILVELPMEGVLGFGLRQSSSGQSLSNPIQMMLSNPDLFAEAIFSFSLNHQIDSHEAGELILGGTDHSLYRGDITWTPLIKTNEWIVRLDSVSLRYDYDTTNNGSSSSSKRLSSLECRNGCKALIDTGTFMIVGHSDDVWKLNLELGGRHVGNGNFQLTDCDLSRFPDLIFTISGREFNLTPELYVAKLSKGCFSLLKAMDLGGSSWILGDRFIGNYYTLFDYANKRIGFAESIYKRGPMIS